MFNIKLLIKWYRVKNILLPPPSSPPSFPPLILHLIGPWLSSLIGCRFFITLVVVGHTVYNLEYGSKRALFLRHRTEMEIFRKFLKFINLYDSTKMDIISHLPTEISNMIFHMLDERSLRSTWYVFQKWRMLSMYELKRRQTSSNKTKSPANMLSKKIKMPNPKTRPKRIKVLAPRTIRF